MSWETSDRRERLPSNWGSRAKVGSLVWQVWQRDGGQCTWKLPSGARCPRPGSDVDHRVNNDNHSLRNLQLLCRHHHDKKTQREAYFGRRNARKGRERREEKHPGYNRH